MALRLREATTGDVNDLVHVINAAFVVERFLIDRARTTVEGVRALFAKGTFLVGEDAAGRIVACVHTERRGDHGYFGLLSVVPECKRMGYGRQLIDEVEAQFRAAGCRQVDIRVVNLRTELPPIYRRLGYVEAGTQPFEDPRASQPCHFILMSKPLSRGNLASDPDAERFARAMTDVVRLAPDPRSRVRLTPVPTAPRVRTASKSTSPSPKVGGEEDSEAGFVAPGVDRRELRRLKRGEHAAASRLDLHGMTSTEAVASLARFIDHERPRARCVCIVHGRGLHSEGNVSVLRTRVRQWLRQHPAVLAYADAPRTDGGSGAVYVLLRK